MKKMLLFGILALAMIGIVNAVPSVPTVTGLTNNSVFEIYDGNGKVLEGVSIQATDSTEADFFCSVTNSAINGGTTLFTWFLVNNTLTDFPVVVLSTSSNPNILTFFCSYDTDDPLTYSANVTYSVTLNKVRYTEADIPKATVSTISKGVIEVMQFTTVIILFIIFVYLPVKFGKGKR